MKNRFYKLFIKLTCFACAIFLHFNCFSQVNYGLRCEYARTNLFDGIGTEIIVRNKKEKYHIEMGLGSFFLGEKLAPKFSAHFQIGNQLLKNSKRLFWVNELNIMYGKYQGSGLVHLNGLVMNCSTVKMALTINTGLEFQIISFKNISLFGYGKLGFGKGLIVEKEVPNCDTKNRLLRFNIGFLIATKI